jgi:phage gp36-like protein
MAYCTTDDVKAEFRSLEVSATTVITSTKMAEFIAQAAQEIDSRIGVKYVVPVTAANALTVLKQIAVWLVADRCKHILEVKLQAPDTGQSVQKNLRKDALTMLTDIIDGRILLPGAAMLNSGGVKSINVSENQEHQFKRNEDQW